MSRHDIWAVGLAGEDALVEHWSGLQWKEIRAPSFAGSGGYGGLDELYAASAMSPTDAWAVGGTDDLFHPRILHWNGRGWKVVAGPKPLGVLAAVAPISSEDVWAVGGGGRTPARALIEHYSC